jgi:hypothetical protein
MMNKLTLSILATAALLAGGAAFAQSGDAESQAGSAWRGVQNYGPYTVPQPGPAGRPDSSTGIGPVPGTPEYYGNSGWTPPAYGYVYRGTDAYGRPIYDAAPVDQYRQRNWRDGFARGDRHDRRYDRQARRDRDGDGVPDRVDRYPNDPSRW